MSVLRYIVCIEIVVLSYLTVLSYSFRAYDCNHQNSNFSVISLSDVNQCPTLDISKINVAEYQIQIVQEKEWSYIHVIHCLIRITKTISYCGMHSHVSMVHGGLQNYILDIDHNACNAVHQEGILHLEGNTIRGIKANSTQDFHITSVGSLDTKGNCDGDKYIIPGQSYENVVVQMSINIMTKDYNTLIKLSSNNILFNDGTSCNYNSDNCIHPYYGNTFWTVSDLEDCTDKSRDVLYEGPASITYDKNPMDIGSIVSINRGSTLLSIKLTDFSHVCHQRAMSTDHPRVYVIEKQKFGFYFVRSTMNPRDVDLALYMNSKIAYSVHELTKQIKGIYQELTLRDCENERMNLVNKIAIVRKHPMSFGNLLTGEPGFYNIIAGEVLYMVKCQPVDVQFRKSDSCTAHLPITYKNQSVYIEPVARVITNTSYEVPCSPLTPPSYNMAGKWYAFTPTPHIIEDPQKLSPRMTYSELKFESLSNLLTSGIYDHDAMDSFKQFMSFPMVKTEATNYITAKISDNNIYRSTSFNTYALLDQRSLQILSDKVKDDLLRFITIFGSIAGTIWGLLIIYKIIVKIISVVMNSLSLYQVFGCSFIIVASLINSITHYCVHFKGPNKKSSEETGDKDGQDEDKSLTETVMDQPRTTAETLRLYPLPSVA